MEKEFEYFLRLWNLSLQGNIHQSPNGLVAKVMGQRKTYILKISSHQGDEHTAIVLSHFKGHGAVRVIRYEGNATLLEYASPGAHLAQMVREGKDALATQIVCDVIKALHSQSFSLLPLPTIEELQRGFERYLNAAYTDIPRGIVTEAETIYKELVHSQDSPIVLHGDLHHDNILLDNKRGWLAIDPKGYIGEPVYEVGAMMRNFFGRNEIYEQGEGLRKRVDIICEQLGYDKTRVIRWSYSQAILAGIWSVEDRESCKWAIDLATSMKSAFREFL